MVVDVNDDDHHAGVVKPVRRDVKPKSVCIPSSLSKLTNEYQENILLLTILPPYCNTLEGSFVFSVGDLYAD